MQIQQVVELDPRYYRDNFLRLCDGVENRYCDILQRQEKQFLKEFRALSTDAQCLYVRLASRVGPCFRVERLDYPEISDLEGALKALESCAMVVPVAELSTAELGRLYTRAELAEVFAPGLAGGARKEELLAAIDTQPASPREKLHQLMRHFGGPVIEVAGLEEVALLQLLFFGNRRQGLTDFVLSDLGIHQYFPYVLDQQSRPFADRAAVLEYLHCCALADTHRELQEAGAMDALLELARDTLELDVRSPLARRRWHRHRNTLARDLERCGETAPALALYSGCQQHPARERQARVLEGGAKWEAARALCLEILEQPWCEREVEAARRILQRVQRKLGGEPMRRARDDFKRLELNLPRGTEPVELVAARALSNSWHAVHYVENKLVNALFGLAFWKQIYASVPGVFHNAYQAGPADMFEGDFRHRRSDLIEERIRQLQRVDLPREIAAAYREYHGYRNQWVNWRGVSEELVARAARVIPRQHLLALWERILFDPRENRSGLPDLVAFGDEPGQYCLIEVKGPGDALQDSQKRWLRFFQAEGIPAAVAWVRWTDD